jgi:hypothetical protein
MARTSRKPRVVPSLKKTTEEIWGQRTDGAIETVVEEPRAGIAKVALVKAVRGNIAQASSPRNQTWVCAPEPLEAVGWLRMGTTPGVVVVARGWVMLLQDNINELVSTVAGAQAASPRKKRFVAFVPGKTGTNPATVVVTIPGRSEIWALVIWTGSAAPKEWERAWARGARAFERRLSEPRTTWLVEASPAAGASRLIADPYNHQPRPPRLFVP